VPELPEVERSRRYLALTSLHQTITDVKVGDRRILRGRRTLRNVSVRKLRSALIGRQLSGTHRHGKFTFAALEGGGYLVLHLGMSGWLKAFRLMEQMPDHVRLLLRFKSGSHLAFVCPRLFGKVALTDDPDSFMAERGFGPDALRIGRAEFCERMARRSGMIKPLLMSQRLVAGLGNLYVDEVLFQTGIHPLTRIPELPDGSVGRIHAAMQRILKLSIRHKTDFAKFPRSYLLRERAEGRRCPRCRTSEFVRTIVGGRGTIHCPTCQPRHR
jgi:formamidopyrimidine-DNA glycosylase